MDFRNPVTDIIHTRVSCRKYADETIRPAERIALETTIGKYRRGPFGTNLRFELVSATLGDDTALKKLGTYGFIKNPQGFLVGAAESAPRELEDFGYVLEGIILKATDLGLGTCWLGGTFTASEFSERLRVKSGESIPAVASIGYASITPGAFERLIRMAVSARKRLPWEALFFDGTFARPLTREKAGRFATPLDMVQIGPSASNKQPWRVVKESDALCHFYLQRSKGFRRKLELLKKADLQRVDMGIAMYHFEAVCREANIESKWVIQEPTPIAGLPERTEYVASFRVS